MHILSQFAILSICTAQSAVLFAEDVEYRNYQVLCTCVYVCVCYWIHVCVDVMLITNKSCQRKQ